jgi:hypothetical protein
MSGRQRVAWLRFLYNDISAPPSIFLPFVTFGTTIHHIFMQNISEIWRDKQENIPLQKQVQQHARIKYEERE